MSTYYPDGTFSARLMGGPNDCFVLDTPYFRWCMLPYPHDGEHQYNRERDDPKSAPGQY
jgi:hypothetical protein